MHCDIISSIELDSCHQSLKIDIYNPEQMHSHLRTSLPLDTENVKIKNEHTLTVTMMILHLCDRLKIKLFL